MFDPTGFGLEVGPSYSPLLPKSAGYNVETIDHADADTLRRKYSGNAARIEEVDHVSDGRSMLEVIGQAGRYDFILASHVIEHVTDIVRFLQDCEELLRPDGRLVLAVPDKRYCFDAFRPVSTAGDALQAYLERRQRHPAGILFDHVAYFCVTPESYVWKKQNLDDVTLKNRSSSAKSLFEAIRGGDTSYHDAHAWRFTPASFRLLVKLLRDNGYIRSGVTEFHTNRAPANGLHEFYIGLSSSAPSSPESDLDLLRQVEAELREVSFAAPRDPEKDALRAQLQAAMRRAEKLARANRKLVGSASWRLTAPLRYLKKKLT